MKSHPTFEIIVILMLGATAQWLAWRLRIPSIVLLLAAGFIAGPLTGWVNPDQLLGDALLPLVSLSVAVILFEGGLSLRIDELHKVGRIVRNLLTIGVAATWMLVAGVAYFVAGLDAPLAIILGALLTVTGPTVIFPMLRHIRPQGRLASILRWEGIVNDPIGALLAVLVFEFVLEAEVHSPGAFFAAGLVKTVIVGGGLGAIAGLVFGLALNRHWIPDYLASPMSLILAVVVYAVADSMQAESGLFAATLAGVVLAYRSPAEARRVLEFKENIRVLLISLLFIVLAARFTPSDFRALADLRTVLFVVILIVIVRPAAVFLSTLTTKMSWSERGFVAWFAPRGIVAAAVSSVFALELEKAGHEQAKALMMLTFATIIGTVLVYGLTTGLIAQRLGVAESNPQGLLFVGAHTWARQLAKALHEHGIRVLLVDTNHDNVKAAHMMGLAAHEGSALAEHLPDQVDLVGIGRLVALTSNAELNAIACHEFQRVFGRASVFQLPPPGAEKRAAKERHLHGTWLFSLSATFDHLENHFRDGATAKATGLTREFDFKAYQARYEIVCLVCFVIAANGKLRIVTADKEPAPKDGETVVAIVQTARPEKEEKARDLEEQAL